MYATRVLAIGWLVALTLPGCGGPRRSAERPAPAPAGAVSDGAGLPGMSAASGSLAGASLDSAGGLRRLGPLHDSDVRLYADVMATAAYRLQHPTLEDRQTLARADAAQRALAGTDPAAPASEEAISRAVELRTRMDDEIVRERHLDARWYGLVRDRIESVVAEAADGGVGAAAADGGRSEFSRLSRERERADAAVLAPHRAEVQRLIREVREASMSPRNRNDGRSASGP